jgi:uncharacterized membrane protein YhhN
MKTSRIFLISFFIVTGIQLAAILGNWQSIILFSKPLIVLALVGYYLASVTYRSPTMIRALFFCWAGDVLLMFTEREESFFMAGLLAFLIGHVLYILTYRKHQTAGSNEELLPTQKIRYSFPIILAVTGLIVILMPSLGNLRLPVLIYAIVLMVMLMTALFRYGRTTSESFWLVFAGASLFLISDSLLAINKFYTPIPFAGFLILLTYSAAQYLIVKGIIKHPS